MIIRQRVRQPMPEFTFITIAGTDVSDRIPFNFPTLEFAKIEAQAILTRMAHERLGVDLPEMFSVEIFNEAQQPLVELRLLFQEIEK